MVNETSNVTPFPRSDRLSNKRELSEVERKFLDVLMDEAGGDIKVAKRLAGYRTNKPLREITTELKDEIIEVAKGYLAENLPTAIATLVTVLTARKNDPVMGARDRIQAALAIMDRAGLAKIDEKQINYSGGIAILPPKDK